MSLSKATERQFQAVIRRLHGCESTYIESVNVREPPKCQLLLARTVHIFDLEGHPTATRCYAWDENVRLTGHRKRFIAVLHQEPVNSPVKAVRASIVQDYRQREGAKDAR